MRFGRIRISDQVVDSVRKSGDTPRVESDVFGMNMQSIGSEMSPESLRARALQRLLDVISDDGMSFQLRVHDDGLYYSGVCVSSDMAECMRRFEGRPHLIGSMTPTDWSASVVRSPDGRPSTGFRRFGEDLSLKSLRESQVWREFYEPMEVTDQLRTMLYAEGELIGYVAIIRRGGEQFTTDEQSLANALIPKVYEDLQLAWSVERTLRDDDTMHLVLDERWNVVYASPSASIWLTPRRRDMLRVLGQSTERRLIDGMLVATTQLDSSSGGLSYASLTMTSLVRHARFSELSAQQQRIVELATKGFTTEEIGRTIHVSPATVKYHLCVAFNCLGVRSRAALANLDGIVR